MRTFTCRSTFLYGENKSNNLKRIPFLIRKTENKAIATVVLLKTHNYQYMPVCVDQLTEAGRE
jgi:hypothetical protein